MLEDLNCLRFLEGVVLLEEVFEIALVADLGDDVRVVGSLEDVVEFEDVDILGLRESSHHGYLVL